MQDEQTQKPAESPVSEPKKKKSGKLLPVILGLLLLVAAGLAVWLWMSCQNDQKKAESDTKDLQNKVETLEKQLEEEQAKSDDNTSAGDSCPAVSQSLKDNIKDAVGSKNYAALQGYMTDPITVIYAGTEFGGAKTPAEAVSAMEYLNNGTAPWDFNLPAATLAGYRAGSYKQYFPADGYVGRAANTQVASFGFKCGKINLFFTSINDDSL